MSGILPATYVKGFHDEEQVKRMEYRTLGKTGLQVSKISFGGGALCANYGYVENMQKESECGEWKRRTVRAEWIWRREWANVNERERKWIKVLHGGIQNGKWIIY